MDWETFKRAVDSLQGFNRTIGIMGGEPTLHPQFERFVKYAVEKHPSKYNLPAAKKPINDFIKYIRDRNFYLDETLNARKGIGLWTSLCLNYYEHYELIQDTFSYQCINDHQNPSLHQPLLASRKELGIPDDEWIPIRDKCWIQNMWSASITPKGAFFCEVAGALDMLFDGPGGWPIERGWWKREPEEFGYQLQWCEICAGALLSCGRLSSEEVDDVSPMMYERLKKVDSPKVKSGKINVLNMDNPIIEGDNMAATVNRYLPDYKKRVSSTNTSIITHTVNAIVFCDSETDLKLFNSRVKTMANLFDTTIVASMDNDTYSHLCSIESKFVNIHVISSILNEWGRTLNKARDNIKGRDWICIVTSDVELPSSFTSRIKKMILNPGVLYRFHIPSISGNVVLFNSIASAIKKAGFDGIAKCKSLEDFTNLWSKKKQIILSDHFDTSNNPDLEDWYTFADNLKGIDKTEIYKCLNKIKNDK